jgi:ABC-type Mn2+/Zn2+ transport system permease subunit
MLAWGIAIATLASGAGFLFANRFDVSIGGAMASATGVALLLALLFGPRHGVLARARRRRSPTPPAAAP